MTITIFIDDSASKEVLQNIALAKGWNEVDDDQARQLLGQDFARQISELAYNGQLTRKRNEEKSAITASLAKVSVT